MTVAGAVGSVLSGAVTLHLHRSFGGGLSEDTRIEVTATAEPDPVEPGETPTFRVTAVSGTGRFSAAAPGLCGRDPEVRSGTAVFGSLIVSADLTVARLSINFTGTSTHTSCIGEERGPTTTTPFDGTLPNGTLVGTPVVVSGRIVAINFDRSENSGSRTLVQTGRLVR